MGGGEIDRQIETEGQDRNSEKRTDRAERRGR